ncbi:unnamed protein product [Amoebophrya sp. A120]|nr:unnamed protein product [Amoebophrya sp. A120]|eukprot:GSA120T00006061001.1
MLLTVLEHAIPLAAGMLLALHGAIGARLAATFQSAPFAAMLNMLGALSCLLVVKSVLWLSGKVYTTRKTQNAWDELLSSSTTTCSTTSLSDVACASTTSSATSSTGPCHAASDKVTPEQQTGSPVLKRNNINKGTNTNPVLIPSKDEELELGKNDLDRRNQVSTCSTCVPPDGGESVQNLHEVEVYKGAPAAAARISTSGVSSTPSVASSSSGRSSGGAASSDERNNKLSFLKVVDQNAHTMTSVKTETTTTSSGIQNCPSQDSARAGGRSTANSISANNAHGALGGDRLQDHAEGTGLVGSTSDPEDNFVLETPPDTYQFLCSSEVDSLNSVVELKSSCLGGALTTTSSSAANPLSGVDFAAKMAAGRPAKKRGLDQLFLEDPDVEQEDSRPATREQNDTQTSSSSGSDRTLEQHQMTSSQHTAATGTAPAPASMSTSFASSRASKAKQSDPVLFPHDSTTTEVLAHDKGEPHRTSSGSEDDFSALSPVGKNNIICARSQSQEVSHQSVQHSHAGAPKKKHQIPNIGLLFRLNLDVGRRASLKESPKVVACTKKVMKGGVPSEDTSAETSSTPSYELKSVTGGKDHLLVTSPGATVVQNLVDQSSQAKNFTAVAANNPLHVVEIKTKVREEHPREQIKIWKLLGGPIGVFIVTTAFLTISKIGCVAFFLINAAGQLSSSMLCDHKGFAGLPRRPLNAGKLTAILVVGGGVLLVVISTFSSTASAGSTASSPAGRSAPPSASTATVQHHLRLEAEVSPSGTSSSAGASPSTAAASATVSPSAPGRAHELHGEQQDHQKTEEDFWQHTLPFMVLAFFGGVCLPIQASVNAAARRCFASNDSGALVSFIGASMASTVVFLGWDYPLAPVEKPVPVWMFAPGLIGAFCVYQSCVIGPRIGQTMLWLLILLGQLVGSMPFDQFGWIGLQQRSLTTSRVLGVFVVAFGVFLNMRYNRQQIKNGEAIASPRKGHRSAAMALRS